MTTRAIMTPEQADALCKWLVGLPFPFTVTVKDGVARTLSQNALLHRWIGEIAKHRGDVTAKEVKGECHRQWALDIRLRDPQFAYVWHRATADMTYEQECALLASEILGVSSAMTKAELTEYMDALSAHWRAEGVRLTDPDAMKYEQEMSDD